MVSGFRRWGQVVKVKAEVRVHGLRSMVGGDWWTINKSPREAWPMWAWCDRWPQVR
jgi:hypothetical protein